MKVVYGLEHFDRPDKSVSLTIGNFDGVHLGHQAIISELVRQARNKGLLSVVMTFEFHPLRLINPRKAPAVLMSLERRLELIEEFGVDIAVIAHCTESLLNMSREDFVSRILVEHFKLNVIVEGENFHFGHKGRGNIDYLDCEGKRLGFDTVKVNERKILLPEYGEQTISSTLIRSLVSECRVDLAGMCLGRRYELIGRVVSGEGLGRGLGFPTANLDCGELMLPGFGVYACKACIDDRCYDACVNVGPAPTFDRFRTGLEAHIIDFSGALYDKRIKLLFYRRIRDIRRFNDVKELTMQISNDIEQAKFIIREEER